MKKVLIILVAILTVFSLVSCNDAGTHPIGANELITLPKDATLNIGTVYFVNNVQEEISDMYLTYTSHITYELHRDYWYSSNVPDNYVYSESDGVYYYWTAETLSEQVLLGKCTKKTEYTYSYLPYAEGESVILKTTAVTSYSYDYEGGFVEKNIDYDIDLNGYFASFEALENELPVLAKMAHTGNISDKYYVDVTTPTSTVSNSQTYTNTYYYVTYQNSDAQSTDSK